MNETKVLIKSKRIPNTKNKNLKIKIPNKNFIINVSKKRKINYKVIIILLIIVFNIFLLLVLIKNKINWYKNIYNNNDNHIHNDNHNHKHNYNNKHNYTHNYNHNEIGNKTNINKNNPRMDIINYEKFDFNIFNNSKEEENFQCNNLDPIYLFDNRLKAKKPICENGSSKHICYQNNDGTFVVQNGVICTMENIILDPSKWEDGGFVYKGPVDSSNRGCPLLSKGFFNMKCNNRINEIENYDQIYNNYFNSWNYEYDENENEEELAPGKTIFFVSRNQDSPNLYHGGSEFVNVVSLVYLLKLKPENIQVVFLESITLNNDPFYDLYKNLISRGGEPIYIKNLTKKYHISSGIHIPINWDSPCFIYSDVPDCKYPTKTYKFYNYLIDKYLNLPKIEDYSFDSNEAFYYPKSIIENYNKTNFTKILTFQWRRVWPKGRKGQQRILGNGPELAEKLSKLLPKNILLRLIDTASLPISEQIAILRKTDYYVGIHGAGLALSIFAPRECIFHEVLPESNMNGLLLMAALSGHKTYSDVINANINTEDGNEMVYFNEEEFANKVIEHMKDNNLI